LTTLAPMLGSAIGSLVEVPPTLGQRAL
jgi:hypothetical protein